MIRAWPRAWLLLTAMLIQLAVCTLGITWGLPTSATDRYLFGDAPSPAGEQIAELVGQWSDASRAADVSAHPLAPSESPIVLTATPEGQAEIITRYRLYSYHPDELLTLRALAGMSPSHLQLDPKLYEYGGLWVYPVGVALRLAALVKLIQLTPDVGFYISHPEAFARFYVVERIVSAAWAVAGVWTVFNLTARMARGLLAPFAAALCFISMPVVVTAAHQGKPHLGAAVLALMAVWAAAKFAQQGSWQLAAAAGALCGATAGMDPSQAGIFLVLPTMVALRNVHFVARVRLLAFGGATGIAIYAATNPYVVLHLLGDRTLLISSAGHVQSFHRLSLSVASLARTVELCMAAMSPPIFIAGLAGVVMLAMRGFWSRAQEGILLCLGSLAITFPVMVVAAGQHMDIARLLTLPSITLAIGAVTACTHALHTRLARLTASFVLFMATLIWATPYIVGFMRDSGAATSRIRAAQMLEHLRLSLPAVPAPRLGVYVEPAAHSVPPMNVSSWQIVYLPAGSREADVIVVLQDADSLLPGAVPLSSADRQFRIERVN